ncbi:ATP-binding protein [Streptomyces clavuligerus]|uniref:ATP-binding protein n=1 Tax=Streptomyces clavuligerus TaxID=1901 RepID=UPI0018D02E0D|nr:ATP-binding protein [Streptomyces clavuligerus]
MNSCAPSAVVYACGPAAIGTLASLSAAAEARGYTVRGAVCDAVEPSGLPASRPGWSRLRNLTGGARPVVVVASRRELGPCPDTGSVVELAPASALLSSVPRTDTTAQTTAGVVGVGRPGVLVWCSAFPAGRVQVAAARLLVRAFLKARPTDGCRWDADEVALAVHELVANAAHHGSRPGDPVILTLTWGEQLLDVTVEDRSPQLPRPRHAGSGACSGRGLGIAAGVAHAVGVSRRPAGPGKTVWMSVSHRLPPRPRYFTSTI